MRTYLIWLITSNKLIMIICYKGDIFRKLVVSILGNLFSCVDTHVEADILLYSILCRKMYEFPNSLLCCSFKLTRVSKLRKCFTKCTVRSKKERFCFARPFCGKLYLFFCKFGDWLVHFVQLFLEFLTSSRREMKLEKWMLSKRKVLKHPKDYSKNYNIFKYEFCICEEVVCILWRNWKRRWQTRKREESCGILKWGQSYLYLSFEKKLLLSIREAKQKTLRKGLNISSIKYNSQL